MNFRQYRRALQHPQAYAAFVDIFQDFVLLVVPVVKLQLPLLEPQEIKELSALRTSR